MIIIIIIVFDEIVENGYNSLFPRHRPTERMEKKKKTCVCAYVETYELDDFASEKN